MINNSMLSTVANPSVGRAGVGARVGVGWAVGVMSGVGSSPPQPIKNTRLRKSEIVRTLFFIYFSSFYQVFCNSQKVF
jgi:hypothetical protein